MRVTLFALLSLAASISFAQADTVKVGAVLPLSGEYESSGAALREGMRVALKDNANTKHQKPRTKNLPIRQAWGTTK